MKSIWKLQDAKNKFSDVVKKALNEGPQHVTKRGVEAVVVLSIKEYRKLIRPQNNLVEFFQKSPLFGVDLDIKRSKKPFRKIEL